MKNMKKKIAVVLTGFLLPFSTLTANADEDYSDTTYWTNLCTNTSSLTAAQQQSCNAYLAYVQNNNVELQSKISEIDSTKEELEENIEYYGTLVSQYNSQIDQMNSMIEDLSNQLSEMQDLVAQKETEIQDTEAAIEAKQVEIEELEEEVRKRLLQEQQTMHVNQYIDVIMGAKSLDDLVRIFNAISDISKYDSTLYDELNASIQELTDMKDNLEQEQNELESALSELEEGQSALNSQQAELLATKYQTDYIITTYTEQIGELDTSAAALQSTIGSNNSTASNISQSIEDSAAATPTPTPTATATASSSSSNSPSSTTDSSASSTATPSATAAPTPTPTATTDSSSSSPTTGDTSGNPYYGGWSNCTWSAWQIAHDLGYTLPWFPGNAGNWLNAAQNASMATGSEPQVYSIAVQSYHVSVVTAINGDMIYIKEGNYLGRYNERWINKSACIGFIYLG